MEKLRSATLTLPQIFNKGGNSFQIPEYQRAYSWGKDQREDLMKDIENVLQLENYKHFTGTIVAQEKNNYNGQIVYDIVDGQQRLTSLVILLSVIAQGQYIDQERSIWITENFHLKGKNTGATIRLFKLGGDLDGYFYRKLEKMEYTSEEHATKAHKNIDDAYTEFRKWFDTNPDDQFAEKVLDVITSKLVFLFHIPDNSSEVGLMFEVINNRGKKLSELEKIKNYLIYYAEKTGYLDIRTAVLNNWGGILFNLNECGHVSNEQENSFLRYTWITFQDTNKSESHHVYDNLKQKFPPIKDSNWERLKMYIEFIHESAETYNKVYSRNLIKDKNEQTIIEQIFFQASTASILPLVLSVYSRVKKAEERKQVLSLIERLNFRYYGCGIANRSDSGNGHLFWLANHFYNKYETPGVDIDWLETELQKFIQNECNEETFIKALTLDKDESGNFYHWNNIKYFLANYEQSIAEKNNEIEDFTRFLIPQTDGVKNANFEKEHIIATNEDSAIKEPDDVNKRRLSNFVLLTPSVNKSIKHAPLYEKINEYKSNSHKYLTPRSLSEIELFYGKENVEKGKDIYTKEFVVEFLDKRETELIKFALKRWGINEPRKVKIDSFREDNRVYFIED